MTLEKRYEDIREPIAWAGLRQQLLGCHTYSDWSYADQVHRRAEEIYREITNPWNMLQN